MVEVDAVAEGDYVEDEADVAARMSLIADRDRIQNVPCVVGRETEVEVKVMNPHPSLPLSINFRS